MVDADLASAAAVAVLVEARAGEVDGAGAAELDGDRTGCVAQIVVSVSVKRGDDVTTAQFRAEPVGLSRFQLLAEIIMLAVRWYLRYGLSYRDLEELLASAASRSTT